MICRLLLILFLVSATAFPATRTRHHSSSERRQVAPKDATSKKWESQIAAVKKFDKKLQDENSKPYATDDHYYALKALEIADTLKIKEMSIPDVGRLHNVLRNGEGSDHAAKIKEDLALWLDNYDKSIDELDKMRNELTEKEYGKKVMLWTMIEQKKRAAADEQQLAQDKKKEEIQKLADRFRIAPERMEKLMEKFALLESKEQTLEANKSREDARAYIARETAVLIAQFTPDKIKEFMNDPSVPNSFRWAAAAQLNQDMPKDSGNAVEFARFKEDYKNHGQRAVKENTDLYNAVANAALRRDSNGRLSHNPATQLTDAEIRALRAAGLAQKNDGNIPATPEALREFARKHWVGLEKFSEGSDGTTGTNGQQLAFFLAADKKDGKYAISRPSVKTPIQSASKDSDTLTGTVPISISKKPEANPKINKLHSQIKEAGKAVKQITGILESSNFDGFGNITGTLNNKTHDKPYEAWFELRRKQQEAIERARSQLKKLNKSN